MSPVTSCRRSAEICVDAVREVLAKVAEGGRVIVPLVGDLAQVVEDLVVRAPARTRA